MACDVTITSSTGVWSHGIWRRVWTGTEGEEMLNYSFNTELELNIIVLWDQNELINYTQVCCPKHVLMWDNTCICVCVCLEVSKAPSSHGDIGSLRSFCCQVRSGQDDIRSPSVCEVCGGRWYHQCQTSLRWFPPHRQRVMTKQQQTGRGMGSMFSQRLWF